MATATRSQRIYDHRLKDVVHESGDARFKLEARSRIADGSKRERLIRAIERSKRHLPLRSALRILRLSSTRYHSWKRDQSCACHLSWTASAVSSDLAAS